MARDIPPFMTKFAVWAVIARKYKFARLRSLRERCEGGIATQHIEPTIELRGQCGHGNKHRQQQDRAAHYSSRMPPAMAALALRQAGYIPATNAAASASSNALPNCAAPK